MARTSARREMPTMSCCTSLRGCRTPTPTTSLGTCRKGCTGITVISMGSRRRRSMRVSWVCFGPSLYLQSPEHPGHGAQFREIASFEPFGGPGGTRVATTSTTTGANLLVSGAGPGSADASVIKYDFIRPNAQATTLEALRLGQVWSGKGSPPGLGGD